MSDGKQPHAGQLKNWIALWFSRAEDVIYVGLGILLAAIAFTLLITEARYLFIVPSSLPSVAQGASARRRRRICMPRSASGRQK
jgi:hypothetical protein